MAVDFGILAQTPSIGARYAEGLQLAQAEQERNMLRAMQIQQMDMQKKNMLAQEDERKAQARLRGQQELELKARMERATREEGYLNKVSELFANNGMPLNLKTAQEGLSYAIKSGDKNAIDMMNRTVASLQEREALQAAFGGQAAPAAAPSIMRQPPAAAAPAAAPTNMFAGTMADIGTTQPAPVNALVAPPQAPTAAPAAPAAGGMSRERLQAIIADPNASKAVVDRAKALLTTLPKEPSVPESLRELEAYMKMTPEQKASFERLQKIKSPSVTATATSTTPTAKSLAGPVGARAETSLVKAEGAAGIMESANMVREALNTGNVIAGPLAGVRTKFAQVLELAGAGDKEKLVNTRTAVQGLATMTLESRAELKGQGQVTENEQKLLERARSGNIEDMTIAELQQVVNVSQRLANRLWSSHQSLLKTMETDPAAADSLRYYRPTVSLPSALGEGRPKAEEDKRKEGLGKIFGAQPQR